MTARRRMRQPPLNLQTMGHMFVGGRIDGSAKGKAMTGQMYAEYFFPHRLKSPYPVVMIHGGFQTGTNFTGTPDGREGWAQYFLRRGRAVYVVDQVARGRSAHCRQCHGAVTAPDLDFTLLRFVSPRYYARWPQARRHTQWPGKGKVNDRIFDAFYATQFPSLTNYPKQQALNRDAIVALLDRIGPAVLLVHSQSGAFA